MLDNFLIVLRTLFKKGLVHMLGANVLNKVLSFLSSIFLVRILSKIDYGTYSYVQNIITFFILSNGLGVVSGFLQFGSLYRNSEKKYSYFKLAYTIGLIFNLLLSLIIIGSSFFITNDSYIRLLLCMMSLVPFFTLIFELLQVYNQVERNNRVYSVLTTVNTITYVVGIIIGAYFFQIYGVIIFNYIAIIFTSIYGLTKFKDIDKLNARLPKLHLKESIAFLKYSVTTMINNSISFLVYILDVFLIGMIIKDMSILATYKTATIIPFALNFIPSTIMIFLYPYFVEHMKEKKWLIKNYKNLLLFNGGLNFIIAIFLIFFSKLIIRICFGNEYLDAVPLFIILSVGYFVTSTFKIPAGNIIASLGKVRINLLISVTVGVLNIVLDIALIKELGSVGAAIATLSVFILSGMLTNYCLFKIIKKIPNEISYK